MRIELAFLLLPVEPGVPRTMVLPSAATLLTLAHMWALSLLGGLSPLYLVCDGAVVSELSSSADVLIHISEMEAISTTEIVPALRQSPEKVKATEGEDVTFSCLLKGAFPTKAEVQWHHHGPHGEQTILRGNHTNTESFTGRVFLSGDLRVGDASMTLLNVSLEDRGMFLCLAVVHNATVLQGSGTKLSILQRQGLFGLEESVGTIVGVVVAAIGVVLGCVAIILTQFHEKLNCLQK